ncbi:MAG: Maf family nucleotide pyrophosphatase [Pseudomonadota bacterium]
MKRKLVLASTSPFRRELLSKLGIPFEVRAPQLDETALPHELAPATAIRLAEAKAKAVLQAFPDALIIGSDQVAELAGEHIGKPITHENAVQQLRRMRGKSVVFHTALALVDGLSGRTQSKIVPTTVHFRDFSDAQIEDYLCREQPYNCAGSAKSEGLGIALLMSMETMDPNALVGLPLIELVSMLKNEGIEVI